MSSVPVKDADNVTRRVDTFTRTEGPCAQYPVCPRGFHQRCNAADAVLHQLLFVGGLTMNDFPICPICGQPVNTNQDAHITEPTGNGDEVIVKHHVCPQPTAEAQE